MNIKHKIILALNGSADGISHKHIDVLREKYGYNELPVRAASLWLLFFRQFQNFMVYILIGAVAVSLAAPFILEGKISEDAYLDAAVILAIVLINAFLGFFQEKKAENAIAMLKKLSAPQAKVRRNCEVMIIPSRELLPGDIMLIEAGDKLSADAHLIESSSLEINESALTGESVPVTKLAELPSEDRDFLSAKIFSGTIVTRGSGEAIVTAIGLKTEIGKITSMVAGTKTPETPLQVNLKKIGSKIGITVMFLCAIIFVMGIIQKLPTFQMLLTVVSLAVAAVPEGLPAIVTVCLALGVQRMIKRNALIRKLDAIETLGSITVICSDKTGTITENEMKVTEIWTEGGKKQEEHMLQIAASCNRAELPEIGDPTEVALLKAAREAKVKRLPIIEEEVPFTSESKYMVTRHDFNGKPVSFYKGAPEVIADMCTIVDREKVLRKNEEFSAAGLRVLAMAYKEGKEIIFAGLIGLLDLPREGVKEAVSLAQHAGIRTIMITGDNPLTAAAIAKKVGIKTEGAVEGKTLEQLDDATLAQTLKIVSVFARVHPAHKVRILQALQSMGEIVAMGGDGVNDAPALKRAHVGIAMGLKGTDVAREAGAMVLTDDNFATIVHAIEEGRKIYDNIRKFILFMFRCNAGEVAIIAAALLFGMPLPLLPLHILWMNLVTDSLPALAMAAEKGERHLMSRPPRTRSEHFLSGELLPMSFAAALNTALALGIFILSQKLFPNDLALARTCALTTTILYQFSLAFSTRTRHMIWHDSPFANRWLILAIGFALFLHLLLLASPLSSVFSLVFPPLILWACMLAGTIVAFFGFESTKYFQLQ